MFFELVAAIYFNMAHLTGLEEFNDPEWRVSKIKRRLLQKDLAFSSGLTKQQFIKIVSIHVMLAWGKYWVMYISLELRLCAICMKLTIVIKILMQFL